jgi:asparagine synthase (glutamine-hydrolysing)
MCGIVGMIGRGSGRARTLEAMVARIRHRGPDHQAVRELDEHAAFGHARLSIIDLSPLGHQPMTSPDGRYTITYNGEVYNFAELKRELAARGHAFVGGSDTEVVLAAFGEWGTGAFERLDGMFALAIWDARERTVTLARDRFGKKPLYFTELGGGLTFASELSALAADPSIPLRRSVAGLNHFRAIGYILAPHTIWRDVYKLEAATWMQWRDGRVVGKARYWDYRAAFARPTREREPEIVEHLRALFDDAVGKRTVGDVPVGAFLSGGVDSSSVCAFLRPRVPYALHTFTVGFEAASYDESADAQRLATRLGTIHHERRLLDREGAALVAHAVDCYDEPFSDTSLVPMVEIARLAGEHVKVVLSGDGADEIFGGYATYLADRLKRQLDGVPSFIRRRLARVLARSPVSNRKTGLGFRLRQFARGLPEDHRRAHYAWRELSTEAERRAWLADASAEELAETHPFHTFRRHYDEAADLDPLAQHLYVDAKTWLTDDVLVKVDRATMASSVEARCPYLDRALVEYVASIPSSLKIRRGRQKYLLKKMLADKLPAETLNKKKAGFNAPINQWLGHSGDDEFRFFNRWVAERRGFA